MIIEGTIVVKVSFNGLYAEDDSEATVLDAVFPDGWDGELDVESLDVEGYDE